MAKTTDNLKDRLKRWLSMKSEDCRHISPLLSDALDRPLTWREKLRVRLHLYTCGACLNYVSNLKFMRRVFRAQEDDFARDKAHESLSPEAAERIKKAIESAN
jgi:hypothetical protein